VTDHEDIEDDTSEVLSLRSHYREYGSHELKLVFEDIAAAIEVSKVTPDALTRTVASCGTHSAKFPNSRSKIGGLNFGAQASNMPLKFYYSGGAGDAKLAKILMRPIRIAGEQEDLSFLDRLVLGDNYTEGLEHSFVSTFGQDCLDAVKAALLNRHRKSNGVQIHHENMPVVFIPGPDGEDLQTTPLPPISILSTMWAVKNDAWEDHQNSKLTSDEEAGGKYGVGYGSWVTTVISGKVRNVALNIGEKQSRFYSSPPRISSSVDNDMWSLKNNRDQFPRWHDRDIANSTLSYAKKITDYSDPENYVNSAMQSSLDEAARRIIRAARYFIDEIVDEFSLRYPDETITPPSVSSVIRTLPVKSDDRAFVHSAIASSHFNKILRKEGEA